MKNNLISLFIFLSVFSLHEVLTKNPEDKDKQENRIKEKPHLKKTISEDELSPEDNKEFDDFLEALLKGASKPKQEKAPQVENKKNGLDILKLLKELGEEVEVGEKEEKRLKEAKAKKKSESSETGATKVFSVAEPSQIKDTLDSVILNTKAKEELDIVVKFFKTPEIFSDIGAERPKGVLLEGPPGTGKTSIGRALAKEAGCKFFYANGSDFDAKFVGEGAKAISELFKEARQNAPSIIFIDEIDTVAKKRTGEESRFHSQTLTKFLTEMDGFIQSDDAVVVIATTNKRDHMDEAVIRFGRFGIEVKVDNPDQESRKKILSLYAGKIKLSSKIQPYDINELAAKAEGFSGADLKKLAQQGALNAIKANRKVVEYNDLENAYKQIKEEKKRSKKSNRKNQIPDYAQNAIMNDRFV